MKASQDWRFFGSALGNLVHMRHDNDRFKEKCRRKRWQPAASMAFLCNFYDNTIVVSLRRCWVFVSRVQQVAMCDFVF